jgi:hypothetical protein
MHHKIGQHERLNPIFHFDFLEHYIVLQDFVVWQVIFHELEDSL